ncbi:hypothetical protein ANRL4_04958 [Anaerolineae bacterium]|nr:hypothetical protein ANRL4_04958 [Anaerolineae bacterium]
MATSTEEQILERLDQILRILALQLVSEKNTITEGARSLKFAGLDNKTISEVLNVDVTVVRTLTSNLRAKPSKNRKDGRNE